MRQTGLFDHLVVLSSFSCGRMDLIRALRNIKRTRRLTSRDGYFVKCELFCMEGKVLFRFYENEAVLSIDPVGYCRVEFYLKDALEALVADRSEEIIVNITQKTIGFNAVRLTADVQTMDMNEKEIPLSLLKEKVTILDPYEPDKFKFYFTRDKTRGFYYQEVLQDIEVVKGVLSKYKIQPKEVETFIHFFLRTTR